MPAIDAIEFLKHNPYRYCEDESALLVPKDLNRYLPLDLAIANKNIEAYEYEKEGRNYPITGDSVEVVTGDKTYAKGLIVSHNLLEVVICLNPYIPFVSAVSSPRDEELIYSLSCSGGLFENVRSKKLRQHGLKNLERNFCDWDSRGSRARGSIEYPVITKYWYLDLDEDVDRANN